MAYNKAIPKINSLNNVFDNNTCENQKTFKNSNDYYNQINSAKLETETDKIDNKLKLKSEMSNNNLKINTPYENHFFAKEMTSRIYSGTQRAKKSCSFREIVYIIHKF